MKTVWMMAVTFLFATSQNVMAMDDMHHEHGGHDMHQMQHDMSAHEHMNHGSGHEGHDMGQQQSMVKFEQAIEADGYQVTFKLELAGGMYHGGDYNLMIKVMKGDAEAEVTAINSKVFFPDGSTDSKMLMKMGGWYMNGYDLMDQGKHGLMVLFKTKDGKKHQANVYYRE